LKTISISFIGDVFVVLYPKAFCIWNKVSKGSFNNSLCCHNELTSSIGSKISLKFTELTLNKSAELSTDGRLLLILSEHSPIIHIYFNSLYTTNDKTKLNVIPLKHNAKVLTCKFKEQNYFETNAKYIPNLILSITADYKICLWIEMFTQPSIYFTCFEIISLHCSPLFAFVQQNYTTQAFHCEDIGTTKLLNPHHDHLLKLIKKFEEFKSCKPNYPTDTNDWLFLITAFFLLNL